MNGNWGSCLACAEPIADGEATYPDMSGTLCAACSPTYAMLLGDDFAFADLGTGEPLPADERRAIYDAHLAAGGKPDDSMATFE